METRYKKLFRGPDNLYLRGAPLIIKAHALLLDQDNNQPLAQVKFQSVSDKKIISVRVSLKSKDIKDNYVGEPVEYEYLDIEVDRNCEFGSKTPIYFLLNYVRSYEINVLEVVFSDKSTWVNDGFSFCESLPTLSMLRSYFSKLEFIDEYKRVVSVSSYLKPEIYEDLWICSCGAVNHEGEERCCKCKTEKEKVFGFLDEHLLIAEHEEWLNKKKEEKELHLKKEEEKRELLKKKYIELFLKYKKKIFIGTIVIVLLVICMIVTNVLTRPVPRNYNFDDIKAYLEKSELKLVNFNDEKLVDDYVIENYEYFARDQDELYLIFDKKDKHLGNLRRDGNCEIYLELEDNDESNLDLFSLCIRNVISEKAEIYVRAEYDDKLYDFSKAQLINDLNLYDSCFVNLFNAIDKEIIQSSNKISDMLNNSLDEITEDGFQNELIGTREYELSTGYYYDRYYFRKYVKLPFALSTEYNTSYNNEYNKIYEDKEKREEEVYSKNDENAVENSNSKPSSGHGGTYTGGHWNIYTGGSSRNPVE